MDRNRRKCHSVIRRKSTKMSLTSFIINGQNLHAFGTDMLQHLDFKTLVKCRQVSREWRDFIDTFLWDRLLVSQVGQRRIMAGNNIFKTESRKEDIKERRFSMMHYTKRRLGIRKSRTHSRGPRRRTSQRKRPKTS